MFAALSGVAKMIAGMLIRALTRGRWKSRCLITVLVAASVWMCLLSVNLPHDNDVRSVTDDVTTTSAPRLRATAYFALNPVGWKRYETKFSRDMCVEQNSVDARINQISALTSRETLQPAANGTLEIVKYPIHDQAASSKKRSTGAVRSSLIRYRYNTVKDIRSYKNVCLMSCYYRPKNVYREPFFGHVHVYDRFSDTADMLLVPTDSRTYFNDSYWVIEQKTGPIPDTYVMHNNTVAYFVPVWRDFSNIYTLWYTEVPPLFKMLQQNQLMQQPFENELSKVMVVPLLRYAKAHIRSVFLNLGFSKIVDFNNHTLKRPICFGSAVFGFPQGPSSLTDIFAEREYLRKQWNLPEICPAENQVMILQRNRTRRILNIDEMGQALLSHENVTNFFVAKFEEKTMKQQFDLVRCLKLFVGVQGAGLAWYRFLPKGATIIEIYYEGWVSKYKDRAETDRPDLNIHAVFCNAVVPPPTWQFYAHKWFGNNDTLISKQMKTKLIEKSAAVEAIRGNIWKDSDVVCSSDALRVMTSLLRL